MKVLVSIPLLVVIPYGLLALKCKFTAPELGNTLKVNTYNPI